MLLAAMVKKRESFCVSLQTSDGIVRSADPRGRCVARCGRGDGRPFAKMTFILPSCSSLFLELHIVVRYSGDKSSLPPLWFTASSRAYRKKRYLRGESRVHPVIPQYFRFLDEFSRMILTPIPLNWYWGTGNSVLYFARYIAMSHSYLIVNTLAKKPSRVLADKLMKENGRTP